MITLSTNPDIAQILSNAHNLYTTIEQRLAMANWILTVSDNVFGVLFEDSLMFEYIWTSPDNRQMLRLFNDTITYSMHDGFQWREVAKDKSSNHSSGLPKFG